MAGKHRVEGSNTAVKVAGVAGIAVAASLLSAGTASAGPFHFGNVGGSGSGGGGTTDTNKITTTSSTSSSSRSFFTTPTNPTVGFGRFITKTNTPPTGTTGGIAGITKPLPTIVTGFCINPRGC